jgi:hypothetical protein
MSKSLLSDHLVGESARIRETLKDDGVKYSVDNGVENSYHVDIKGVEEYFNGMKVAFKASNNNSDTSTFEINNLGPVPITKSGTDELDPEDVKADQISILMYDGTNFQIISGTGGTITATRTNRVVLGFESNTFDLGIANFNISKDYIQLYQNSTFIQINEDYTISGSTVTKSSGTWAAGTIFDVIVMKTVQEKADLLYTNMQDDTYTASTDGETEIPFNISFSSTTDKLMVYYQGTRMVEGDNYTLNGTEDGIILQDFVIDSGESVYFEVLKKVTNTDNLTSGSQLNDHSINEVKLSNELIDKINIITANEVNFTDTNVNFTASDLQSALEALNNSSNISFDDTNFFGSSSTVKEALELIGNRTVPVQIISSSDFISGSELSSALGITAGTLQFSNTPWIRFPSHLTPNGKTLYTTLKTIRYGISWDALYQAGAVYGTGSTISDEEQYVLDNDTSYNGTNGTVTRVVQDAQVTVNNANYKVRLFKGANDIYSDDNDTDRSSIGPNNEWNLLMLPLHEHAEDGNWNYPEHVPDNLEDWNLHFNDSEMLTHNNFGAGNRSWCQEFGNYDEGSGEFRRRVDRGYYGASYLCHTNSYYSDERVGWRPVLEIAD